MAVLASVGLLPPAGAADGERWTGAGTLGVARYDHTATLLSDGAVLVAGGVAGTVRGELPSWSAERLDPPDVWQAVGSLAVPRAKHTATRLDARCSTRCGDVLAVGGWVGGSLTNATAAAELYDADSGTWSLAAPLLTPRYNHSATVLQDGRVLVAGGRGAFLTSSVEIYDPEVGTWSLTGSLNEVYYDHTATLLPDGRVLVVGAGSRGSSAELYDPVAGSWSRIAAPVVQRFEHTATLLADGRVLVVGTAGGTDNSGDGQSAEVYERGTWSRTGSLSTRRASHTATLLGDGRVLVAGGADIFEAALYEPASGSWRSTAALATARSGHTSTRLASGQVLVAGGRGSTGLVAAAEMYDPRPPTLVSVGDATIAEGHAGSRSAVFAVSLSEPSARPVTVGYSVVGDTAGIDDYSAAAGTVAFAAGSTSATIEVAVVGDTVEEGDETFSIVLSTPTGAAVGDGVGRGVIVDDDPSPPRSLAIGDASVHEGNAGIRTVVMTVSLSRPTAARVSVSYATGGGSATASADYSATGGTVTFAPGETSRTIGVTVLPDRMAEGAETVVVTLSAAVGALVGDGTGVATVLDDD